MSAYDLGSKAWLEDVFQAPPARDVTGRSRPTQRIVSRSDSSAISVAEGGNTGIARSLLTTCTYSGQVRRFKLEPFRLTVAHHGIDAIPDAIFETEDRQIYVVEAKSKKYLTKKKLEKCQSVEKVLSAAGLTYLLWTSAWPLSQSAWRTMREVRRLGTSDVPHEKIMAVATAVSQAPMRMEELRAEGLYREYVCAAVWAGLAHLNLFADIDDHTQVSSDPRDRKFEYTLTASVAAHSWWDDLPAA